MSTNFFLDHGAMQNREKIMRQRINETNNTTNLMSHSKLDVFACGVHKLLFHFFPFCCQFAQIIFHDFIRALVQMPKANSSNAFHSVQCT